MDTVSLSCQLTDILSELDQSSALEALDSLLKGSQSCRDLFEEKETRLLLSKIEARLLPEVLRYELAREIREKIHAFLIKAEENKPGKSLHSLQGAFLWVKGNCASLFQTPKEVLLQSSLFDLMAPSSVSHLYSRYGAQMLNVNTMASRTLTYEVKGVLLVSRCTPAFYTDGSFNPKLGVFVETRRSKRLKPLPLFSPRRLQSLYPLLQPGFFLQSPATPLFLGVPTDPFSTPTKGSEDSPQARDVEAHGSLSPSLLSDCELPVRGFLQS